jgi:hypothetical protein
MNHRDVEWLLGRRFVTDFTVLAVDDDPDRTVTLALGGDKYLISFEELQTVIERGFVYEGPLGLPGDAARRRES